jgi:hypothetical protein
LEEASSVGGVAKANGEELVMRLVDVFVWHEERNNVGAEKARTNQLEHKTRPGEWI